MPAKSFTAKSAIAHDQKRGASAPTVNSGLASIANGSLAPIKANTGAKARVKKIAVSAADPTSDETNALNEWQ